MTDDDLKNLLHAHVTALRRHFDVTVERMEKQFSLVPEVINQVDQRLDRAVCHPGEALQRTTADKRVI
ncbi:MAG: hypothetical protein WA208_11870 [Thermoanaerobaculia bacterium]